MRIDNCTYKVTALVYLRNEFCVTHKQMVGYHVIILTKKWPKQEFLFKKDLPKNKKLTIINISTREARFSDRGCQTPFVH